MNALWFSRHAPTEEQLAEISAKGFSLCALEEGTALGAVAIDENGPDVVGALRALAVWVNARAVFGVFPTPILGAAFALVRPCLDVEHYVTRETVALYAAHNVSRTPEGATRPTFAHKEWVQVGVL